MSPALLRKGSNLQKSDLDYGIFPRRFPRRLSIKEYACIAGDLQEMWVRSLGQGDPLEWEMAGYSNILAWKNPMGRRDWLAVFHGVANSVGCELAIKQQQWPVRELSDKMTYVFKFMLLYCPPGFHNFNSRTIERLFFLYFQEYWMVFLFGMRHVN